MPVEEVGFHHFNHQLICMMYLFRSSWCITNQYLLSMFCLFQWFLIFCPPCPDFSGRRVHIRYLYSHVLRVFMLGDIALDKTPIVTSMFMPVASSSFILTLGGYPYLCLWPMDWVNRQMKYTKAELAILWRDPKTSACHGPWCQIETRAHDSATLDTTPIVTSTFISLALGWFMLTLMGYP